eukprot:TRINITY_DN4052_c0_g1_i7.p1 TRINITY_DN4052_c0_g1~~TRINITY_DN4052_c0_g1_i7.p1  ORF type:complete len:330 (+),score=36.25 TRINITY_DN4052_c0_g1_i7:1437-2426(+)
MKELYDEQHIWNYDEVPFYFEPNLKATIEEKGKKTVPILSMQAQQMRMTLVIIMSASGIMTPPILLYFSKGFKKFAVDYPGVLILSNTTAYNNESTMYNDILPYICKFVPNGSLLIFDKCPAHSSERIKDMLAEHKIQPIEIPGGTTCLLQPVDCPSIGKKVKEHAKKLFIKWCASEFENIVAPEGRRKKNFKRPTNKQVAEWILDGLKQVSKSDIEVSFISTGILSKERQQKILTKKVYEYFTIVKEADYDFLHTEGDEDANNETSKTGKERTEEVDKHNMKKDKLMPSITDYSKIGKDVVYKKSDWAVVKCIGDGNCLFRANLWHSD